MSTPMPPQTPYGAQNPYAPQNPYGQQPPQGPYAPGPYGQPQPQPSYGTPYPQQPAGYGWGVPPVAPPPPPKRRLGLVFGILGGFLAVSVVGYAMNGSKLGDGGFPEAEYRLSLPRTLVDNHYELTRDVSETEGRKLKEEAAGSWDVKLAGVAYGHYSPGGDEAKGELVVMGLYGRFKDPAWSRNDMMKGGGDGERAEVVVAPKDFHPVGSGGITISCEVSTRTDSGVKVTLPLCGWVDANTSGAVFEVTNTATTDDPSDVDLDKLAATTLQIRSEMRKPI
nr:hypothetical protein OH837_15525 [Streptomyces canus]